MAAYSVKNSLSTWSSCGIKAHSALALVKRSSKHAVAHKGFTCRFLWSSDTSLQGGGPGIRKTFEVRQLSQSPENEQTNSVVRCYQLNIHINISSTELSAQSLLPLQAAMNPLLFTLQLIYCWFQFMYREVIRLANYIKPCVLRLGAMCRLLSLSPL